MSDCRLVGGIDIFDGNRKPQLLHVRGHTSAGYSWLRLYSTSQATYKTSDKRKPSKKAARLLQGLKVAGDGVLHAAVGRKAEKTFTYPNSEWKNSNDLIVLVHASPGSHELYRSSTAHDLSEVHPSIVLCYSAASFNHGPTSLIFLLPPSSVPPAQTLQVCHLQIQTRLQKKSQGISLHIFAAELEAP